MKVVRIQTEEGIRYGVVEEEGIRVYDGSPLVMWEPTEALVEFSAARLLAPVFPTKVVCVGRNYGEHAREMDSDVPESPLIFLKPSTAVIGPEKPIVLPSVSQEVHHEAEMAVIIGTGGPQRGRRRRIPGGAGLHGRQRCDRPRPATPGRAVDAGQRLRHVLPAGAGPSKPNSTRWRIIRWNAG